VLNCRRVFILVIAALVCWSLAGCSSSSSPKTTQTGSGSGLQLSPSSNQSVEVNASGVATLQISASESVSWSLASATGFGRPPAQAALSSNSGTSTTFTYTGTAPSCSLTALPLAPQAVDVVATTSGSSPATAVLTVNVVQSPPCLSTTAASWNELNVNPRYASCPAAGTVFTLLADPPIQAGVYAQNAISVGELGGVLFGAPPFTWTLTGSIPSGMELQTSSDTTSISLVGTPSTPQCWTFQLQVTDSLGGVSCDPNVTTSCAPTTFNLAVVPAPLKISVAPYSYSYDGVPYPPVDLQVSTTIGPYTWFQDPLGQATLAPGLVLNSASGSSIAEISGMPNAGDSATTNGAGSSTGQDGQYPTLIYVSDSQMPYPAVGVASLNMEDFLPNTACSPSSAPLSIAPGILNGGVISANPVPASNYLNGTYGFMLRGFDTGQPTVIAGSMTVDGNGNVTSGILDLIKGGNSTPGLVISGGTYAVGLLAPNLGDESTITYNRGCVTLNTTAGPITFDYTLGGCSNHYSEGGAVDTFDNACGMSQNSSNQNIAAGVFTTGRIVVASDGSGHSATMSGILREQNNSAFSSGLSGPYAFGLAGWDSSDAHYAVAGSMQASSSTLSAVAADINDAGTLSSQLTGGSGTLSSADVNGRITGTLSVGSASFDVALYEISANEAFVVTTDALASSHPLLTGEALTTSSSFSAASFQNNNILAMGGVATAGPDVSIALLTFDGVSSVTGTLYQDQAATLGTTSVTAVYTVDGTTGRTTFTTPQQGESLGSHGFIAYLIPASPSLSHVDCSVPASCVTGFVVGTDSTVQDGIFEFQTPPVGPPPPFSNRYIAGDYVYGTMETLDANSASFDGDVFATPSATNATGGNLGGVGSTGQVTPFYQDTIYGCLQSTCPVFIPEDTFQGSYSLNSNGSGIGSFGGGPIISIMNGNVTISIDESPANAYPSIIIAEQ
jgi:hypothetical protein